MIFINHRCNFWRSICPWPCPIRLTAPGCGKALFSSWATSKTITITFLIKFDRWYFYLKIEQDQHYMYKFKAANNALFKGFQFSGARKRPWGNWAERVCLPWYTLVYHHHGIPWYTMDHGMYTTTMAPPPQILKIRSVLGRVTKKHPWTVSTPHTQIFQIGLSSSSTFESLILYHPGKEIILSVISQCYLNLSLI